MKKLLPIFILFLIFTACDNDEGAAPPALELTVKDSIQIYEGNFITAGNDAVLKGNQFIFQVAMGPKAISLRDSLKHNSSTPTIRRVVVKGKVTNNQTVKGYSQIIEITEILEIANKEKSTN